MSPLQPPLRIAYVWDRALPTTAADAEQGVSTIAALSRRGVGMTLVLPRPARGRLLTPEDLARHYQVEGRFSLTTLPAPMFATTVLRKPLFALTLAAGAALPPHDLVYTRNAAVMLLLLRRGFRVFYDTHRAWPNQLPLLAPLFRRAMTSPGFVGAALHSEYSRQCYIRCGAPADRLRTIRNGFDPARLKLPAEGWTTAAARAQLSLPAAQKLVVYTGHISMLKGFGAVLALAERCLDVRFLLVGSEGNGAVERKARQHPNIEVLPWQPYDRAALYMAAADVLLLPPSDVGLRLAGHTVLPLKLYGYLAAGRPILAAATPDVGELLSDGVNAVLTPPGDIDAAAKALRSIFADADLRRRLGAAARATGAAYTWDARAAALEAFIRERLAAMDA